MTTFGATFGTGDYQYEVVEGWGLIPQPGLVSGVACDSNDSVYVYNRSPQPAMLVFEADGTFVTEWGKDIFKKLHGIWIDANGDLSISEVIADRRFQKFARV